MAVLIKRLRLHNPSIRRRRINAGNNSWRKSKKRFFKSEAGKSWKARYEPQGIRLRKMSRKRTRVNRSLTSTTRKRKMKNPKRMSLAQKLHFGTARQRAAARLSLKNKGRRKNAGRFSIRKTKKDLKTTYGYKRVHAPVSMYKAHAKATKARRRARRKNVGEIVSISLAGLNPGRKRRRNTKTMARTRRRRARRNYGTKVGRSWSTYSKRRKKNPGVRRRRRATATTHRRRRRSNPSRVVRVYNRGRRRVMHRRHHRRNPGVFSGGTITNVAGLIGGLVASKYLTQLALGGNNTGYVGYAGNLVASVGLGWATGKVFKNKQLGQYVMYGGLAGLAARVLMDMTPIGKYVNLSLTGAGKGGDLSLGIIQDSSFPVPQTFAPGSMTNAIVPAATRAYVGSQVAQMQAAGSKGVSGMGMMRGRAVRRAII